MSMCSYCTFPNSNHTMRLCSVSDIRTDNYIVVSGSRTTAPFIIQEEWNALAAKRLWPPPFRTALARFYLPHTGLVLPYLIEIPSTPLQSKIGACGVLLSGLPISNQETTARRNFALTWYNQSSDFKSGYCRQGLSSNFRVGANQIPLCSFQKRKAAYIPPENRGYVCPG